MKKTAVVFALIVFSMVIILACSFSLQLASAQTSSYTIQSVDQTVQVLYSGHVVITEAIQLSGSTPSTFDLGLPFKYSADILQGIAYDKNYNVLPITLGVQLQGQSGFYGASVTLPSGTSLFTVVFVLSNAALSSTSTGYVLDFPAYPAFTQTVGDYNGNLSLPLGATIVGIDKPDGVVNGTTYNKANLSVFTYSPATATFSAAYGVIQKVNIPTLSRQVTIGASGAVSCTDTYKIENNSTANSITFFLINLPVNASNVVARDQFGRELSAVVQQSNNRVFVQNVTLAVPIGVGESNVLTLDYSLPSISHQQFAQYVLNLDLFPYFNYYVDSASVSITPPEGATIVSPQLSEIGSSADLARNAYQQTLTINKDGISYIDSVIPSEDIVPITFDYNALWISFRPTIWMFVAALIGAVVVAVWKRPRTKAVAPRKEVAVTKVTAPVGVALSSEQIRRFTDAYEQKQKLTQEIRTLDARARHGRISRRRYKVQRRTLELRLETLSHTINQVRAILNSTGGTYADIARRMETAEVEINEVELSLQTIEVRHESGEISLETYRKQLSDLERRREKAEETINGLLLRLRGEMQ